MNPVKGVKVMEEVYKSPFLTSAFRGRAIAKALKGADSAKMERFVIPSKPQANGVILDRIKEVWTPGGAKVPACIEYYSATGMRPINRVVRTLTPEGTLKRYPKSK